MTQQGKVEHLRDVEYERIQEVGMDGLGPGRGLHLTLELPPPEPAASTVLDIDSRRWELQITCEAPGVDLETTFLLPVYFSGGV